jgi:hypothetical protein
VGLYAVPPRLCWHERLELGLERRHSQHGPLCASHEERPQWRVIPRGAWPIVNDPNAGSAGGKDEDGRVVHLHRSGRGGHVGRQWLVMRERAMASYDVVGCLAREIGLRVGGGDEGRVGRGGRERVLGHARFGVGEDGAED